jgi:hypothetical protein
LNAAEQLILSRWLTLKVIIGDRDQASTSAIPSADSDEFFHDRSPLPDSQIYVGYYEGTDWQSRFRHAPFYAGKPGDLWVPDHLRKPNGQITIISYGHFFAFITSSAVKLTLGGDLFETRMHQIWPAKAEQITLPQETITDKDADQMSTVVRQISNSLPPAGNPFVIASR